MRRVLLCIFALLAAGPQAAAGPGIPDLQGPDVPALTAPVAVVDVFTDERFDCTEAVRTKTVQIPQGPWNRVVLEFSSTPDGDPWDRLFGVALGGVEVLRGTTPRTSFTLRKDVTEYATLLPAGGTADVSLLFGSYVGAILGSVTLEFYAGEPVVREPREAVGAFRWGTLAGPAAPLQTQVAFPSEPARSAVVEITLTGHGSEEGANPALRAFRVFVDDVEVQTVVPMPYRYAFLGFGNANANTPCSGPGTSALGDAVHPVMWWTAQRAADVAGVHWGVGEIPSYRADVDPALLTGTHTIRVVQDRGQARWVTSLSFLLQR